MTLYHTKIVTKRNSGDVLMACYIEAPTPGQAREKLLYEFFREPSQELPEQSRRHILMCQRQARDHGGALAIATKSTSRTPGQASYVVTK